MSLEDENYSLVKSRDYEQRITLTNGDVMHSTLQPTATLRELDRHELDLVSGGDKTHTYTDSEGNRITEYWSDDGSQFLKLTCEYDTGGSTGGSFYGGGWVALGTGAGVSGGGGDAHGWWGVGVGGGLEIGFSEDPATASQESDNTEFTFGFIPAFGAANFGIALIAESIVFDANPLTIGVDVNFGGYMPLFERHNEGPLEPDQTNN
jgi:hypothetical protein